MIILLHGDDITKVGTKRQELTEREGIIKTLDLKKATLEEVLDTVKSEGLFTDKKTIILQNIKSLHHTKRKKLTSELSNFKKDTNTKIIILQETVLDKKTTAQMQLDQEFKFELPKYFFMFLDALAPRNAEKLHDLIAKMNKSIEGEQLFYATVNRMRLIVMQKTGNPEQFDEVKRVNPWVRQKLGAQASQWSQDNITSFYKGLMDIEFGMKTSSLPLTTTKHLDLLILKHLK